MKHILPLLFLFLSTLSFAQARFVGYTAEAPAATAPMKFTEQHHAVIAQANYLMDMPADKDVEKRAEAARFVANWIKSSNDVDLNLEDKLMPYLQYNEALAIFMGSYAQFSLTHPTTDHVAANIAGMYSVVSYYLDNKETLGFDVLLEKLVDMRDSGRLRGFIKRRIG